MGSATDELLGVHINRKVGDPLSPGDHNELARWLSVTCRALLGGPLEEAFVRGYHPVVDADTGRIQAGTLIGFIGGRPIYMTAALEHAGEAASGTTTSLTDSTLYGETDFWNAAWVSFTSGANAGLSRQVSAYNDVTRTLSWTSPLPQAVAQGDQYVVSYFYVQDILITGTRYIFARSLQKIIYHPTGTPSLYAPAEFVARGSATPAEDELLVGTATVSGGNITSTTVAGNSLYVHMGQWIELNGSGLVEGLPPASYVDIAISHDRLAQLGGISVACDDPHTITVVEHWKDDEFTVRVTNTTDYEADVNFTWRRAGRLLA